MTEPTPNADEALAARWLKNIGGVSTIFGAIAGFIGGIFAGGLFV